MNLLKLTEVGLIFIIIVNTIHKNLDKENSWYESLKSESVDRY